VVQVHSVVVVSLVVLFVAVVLVDPDNSFVVLHGGVGGCITLAVVVTVSVVAWVRAPAIPPGWRISVGMSVGKRLVRGCTSHVVHRNSLAVSVLLVALLGLALLLPLAISDHNDDIMSHGPVKSMVCDVPVLGVLVGSGLDSSSSQNSFADVVCQATVDYCLVVTQADTESRQNTARQVVDHLLGGTTSSGFGLGKVRHKLIVNALRQYVANSVLNRAIELTKLGELSFSFRALQLTGHFVGQLSAVVIPPIGQQSFLVGVHRNSHLTGRIGQVETLFVVPDSNCILISRQPIGGPPDNGLIQVVNQFQALVVASACHGSNPFADTVVPTIGPGLHSDFGGATILRQLHEHMDRLIYLAFGDQVKLFSNQIMPHTKRKRSLGNASCFGFVLVSKFHPFSFFFSSTVQCK